ncbi:MAG TPA: type 1 glutamine amidotransferase domain-containing protein, partial [Gammaproteobacteria bacterium]
MKRKILFALTSHDRLGDTDQATGFYLPEAAHPWAVLREQFHIDFISPRGGRPPMYGVDTHDPQSRAFLDDPAVTERLDHSATPEQVNPADYAAILFVGGHGTMWDFADND